MERRSSVSIRSYIIGFVLAVALTISAYSAVVYHLWTGVMLTGIIMGLAVIQLIVQLVFFLHFGRGQSARWNMAAFFFMLIVLTILVAGSLWIMYSLNYNMMPSSKMNTYMQSQSNEGF